MLHVNVGDAARLLHTVWFAFSEIFTATVKCSTCLNVISFTPIGKMWPAYADFHENSQMPSTVKPYCTHVGQKRVHPCPAFGFHYASFHETRYHSFTFCALFSTETVQIGRKISKIRTAVRARCQAHLVIGFSNAQNVTAFVSGLRRNSSIAGSVMVLVALL